MSRSQNLYLDSAVAVEPLHNNFMVWLHTLAPATFALHLWRYQLPILMSYVDDPSAHEKAVRTPRLRGGPYADLPRDRLSDVERLIERIHVAEGETLRFAEQLLESYRAVASATGESLEALGMAVPEDLSPYAELVYDVHNRADLRLDERALYRRFEKTTGRQSIRLTVRHSDSAPLLFSTPRFVEGTDVELRVPFDDHRLARVLAGVTHRVSVVDLAEDLGLVDDELAAFARMFREARPPDSAWRNPGVRIRYFGHAGLLVESDEVAILVDPFVSSRSESGRFAFDDLPARVDFCLLTHGHADHMVFETLMKLRALTHTIVVPRNAPGVLQDPSLSLALRQLGYDTIVEVDPFQCLPVPSGHIVALPFYGEHADLAISAKSTYGISIKGRGVFVGADTRVPTAASFADARTAIGRVDALFLGMECDGAPLPWLYGPLLSVPVSRKVSKARTLSGSNAVEAARLTDALSPQLVGIYAMGFEPWVSHIMAIDYGEDAIQLQEIDRFTQHCRDRGIQCETLKDKAEWIIGQ